MHTGTRPCSRHVISVNRIIRRRETTACEPLLRLHARRTVCARRCNPSDEMACFAFCQFCPVAIVAQIRDCNSPAATENIGKTTITTEMMSPVGELQFQQSDNITPFDSLLWHNPPMQNDSFGISINTCVWAHVWTTGEYSAAASMASILYDRYRTTRTYLAPPHSCYSLRQKTHRIYL